MFGISVKGVKVQSSRFQLNSPLERACPAFLREDKVDSPTKGGEDGRDCKPKQRYFVRNGFIKCI
ncbi:hypothetical protein DHC50_09280 [Arenibacter sp. A80]|nr:hypothetical protein [Arenibacter sp. A80]RFT56504.1 hypothetical protein D0S24_09270 [Arenibacter sp. P308M17]